MARGPAECDPEQQDRQDPGRQMFSISYETLVKAFIGGLIALMVWSYGEISALRKEKLDKQEFLHEVTLMKESLKSLDDNVRRQLEQNAQAAARDRK